MLSHKWSDVMEVHWVKLRAKAAYNVIGRDHWHNSHYHDAYRMHDL